MVPSLAPVSPPPLALPPPAPPLALVGVVAADSADARRAAARAADGEGPDLRGRRFLRLFNALVLDEMCSNSEL